MLVTAQPVLQRFWYPTLRTEALWSGPQPFTLLGQDIVLWRDSHGLPAAAIDRCCHRFARLSCGSTIGDNIRCPYHGWEFNPQGSCVAVPQTPGHTIPSSYRIEAFLCAERYGYVWVCLGEPLAAIPDIPEATDPRFRAMHLDNQHFECSSLAGMDNFFDNSHHYFVHGSTLGDPTDPTPMAIDGLEETPDGIFFRFLIRNYGSALSGGVGQLTLLARELTWFLPFTACVRITFPTGTRSISIVTFTPISDSSCQFSCLLLRDDTEEDLSATEAVAQISTIVAEDKRILECVDPDVPLDPSAQRHMGGDLAGIMMRKKFKRLLDAHGELEVTRFPGRLG